MHKLDYIFFFFLFGSITENLYKFYAFVNLKNNNHVKKLTKAFRELTRK